MGVTVNDSESIAYETEDAISYAGLLMTTGATVTKAKLCDATERPFGFAVTDTKDVDGNAQSGVMVGVRALRDGMIVELRVSATNTAITAGNVVTACANGYIDNVTSGDYKVGIALDSVPINTGGTCTVRIQADETVTP